jgi:hypothetical protein
MAYFADLPSTKDTGPGWSASWLVRCVAFVGFYSYSIYYPERFVPDSDLLFFPVKSLFLVSGTNRSGYYLWHGYFSLPVTKRLMVVASVPIDTGGPASLLHAATYVVVSITLGVAGYWLVELPFLAVRDRLFPRKSTAPA